MGHERESINKILLVVVALSAAAFLFGAMRSFATFSGTYLRNILDFGGPVTLFILVLVLGFYLPVDSTTQCIIE
jgi:hypothetical protein